MQPPASVWIPVNESYWEGPLQEDSSRNFPLSVCSKQDLDVGLIILLICTIVTARAAVATAATSLVQSDLTATAVEQIVSQTASALETQNLMNTQLHTAVRNLQQQADLLAEDVKALWEVTHFPCDARFPSYCLTPYATHLNRSAYRQNLSQIILGPWSPRSLHLMRQLSSQLVQLNNTSVDRVKLDDLSSFFSEVWSKAMSWLSPSTLFLYGVWL